MPSNKMRPPGESHAATPEDMEAIGRTAADGEVITHVGQLGAGKTHGNKGFVG